MLADRTAPREQASLDYLSPPFQLSNWKWRHAGRPPPVVLRTFSLARFPHNDSTLQMRVTSDKSFRTSGEAFPYLSLSLSLFVCRAIAVKDPHLLCSRARATGPANEGNQALRALLTRVSAAPQLQRAPRYTRASLRGRYVSPLVPVPVSRQSRGCNRQRIMSGSGVSTELNNLK